MDKDRSFNNCFKDKCLTSTKQLLGATHLIVTGVMAPRLLGSSIVRRNSITIRLKGYPLVNIDYIEFVHIPKMLKK